MFRDPRLTTPARNGVPLFFAITFAFTWALQTPAALARRGAIPGSESYLPLAALGMFGPLVAAAISLKRETRLGLNRDPWRRDLFAGLGHWRVGAHWYFVALAAPGLALGGLLCLLRSAGYTGQVFLFPDAGQLVAAVLVCVVEEVGWRGHALPRLQAKYGAWGASGVIGLLWTVWHVPLFAATGVPLSLLPVMLLYFVGGSLMFTWVFNRTGGSLLLVVLAHLGAHLQNSHLALPSDTLPLVAHAIVYAALGLGAALLDRRFSPPTETSHLSSKRKLIPSLSSGVNG